MPPPPPLPFSLRAATNDDYDWLWNVKRLTMRPYVEQTWGTWDDSAQERFFRRHFNPHTLQVIVVTGRDAGLLDLEREPDSLFLANIQLHPDFQNRGLGAAVMRTVMETARTLRLPLRLQVLKANQRALGFYARLGFHTYQETLTHYLMKVSAPSQSAQAAPPEARQ